MAERRFWQSSPFDVPLLRLLSRRGRADRSEGEEGLDEDRDPTPGKIRLRHFAGPAVHATQLTKPLKVAHLTDIHVGRVTPMRVQRAAVQLTNAQNPDLVVITGDFVCHSHEYLDALGEIASGFKAPVAAVLGNHDYWSGAAEVRRTLKRAGVELLDNVHTTITLRGERLQLVGLDDAYTGHARPLEAVKGLRKALPALGLSHIAEEADFLWSRGVPLVLSGHTHGGQVTLAGLHELAVGKFAGHKYVHGLYGTRDPTPHSPRGAVYVGAGIGASVMPLRIGERGRREVAIFELGAAPGTIDEHLEEQAPLPGRPPTPEQKRKRAAKVLRNAQRRALKAARKPKV